MKKKNFKNVNKNVAQRDKLELKNDVDVLMEKGDLMADAILNILTLSATDWKSIGSAAYALARAWASVKVIAERQNCPVDFLFNTLTPGFEAKVRDILEEHDLENVLK